MQASGTVRAERREGEIPMEQPCKLPFVLLSIKIKEMTNGVKTKNIELMTRKEVASYLKVSLRTVDNIIHKKDFLGKVYIGRRVMVDKAILNEYIENQYE